MKKQLLFIICVLLVGVSSAQVYNLDATTDGDTINTCSAILYDSGGGVSGVLNYGDTDNYSITFCNPGGGLIRANTVFLNTQLGADILSFYDGASTASPLLGGISGYSYGGSGTFTSTGSCITIEFVSDGDGQTWEYPFVPPWGGFDVLIGCLPANCANGSPAADDDCGAAPAICSLDQYCGNTGGWYTQGPETATIAAPALFCGSIENNSWVSFVAENTTATFDITSSGCLVAGSGIQAQIFDTDCSVFTAVSNCVNQNTGPGLSVLTAVGLTPGQTYYIMVDGFGGNICDYTIEATSGVATVEVESSIGDWICPTGCTTLELQTFLPATSYTWTATPAGTAGLSTAGGTVADSIITMCPTANGTYEVIGTATGICGGSISDTFSITVGPPNVDFHASLNGGAFDSDSIISPFPSAMSCTDDWIYLIADDSATAGMYVVPALHFVFNALSDNNDNIKVYSGGSGVVGSGTQIYGSTLPDNTIYTVYGGYLSPSTSYYIEICDVNPGEEVDWEVFNGSTLASLGSGTSATGGGCTRYGPFSPTGSSSWASTAPVASFASFDYGLMWFDPSAAGPGVYDFTYYWDDGINCVDSATRTITVTSPHDATWTSPGPLCIDDADVNLDALITGDAGGTFVGTGVSGAGTVPDPYVFDPSVGSQWVGYIIGTSSACFDTMTHFITVNPLPDASFTGLSATLCLNDGSVTLVPAVSGGTFSGPGVSGTTFDPSSAGVGGPYTIKYVVTSGGCTDSTSQTVTVSPLPDASFTGLPATLCLNDGSVTLVPAVSGGTFSGPGVSGTTFDPSSAGAGGPYTIKYVVTSGGCTDSTSETITVSPLPDASFTGLPATLCLNDGSVTLVPAVSGGTFSGPGVSGTTFDPSSAGAGGPYTIKYVVTSGGCTDSTSETITVNPLPDASFTGLPAILCLNDGSVTLVPTVSGGTFSGPGVSGTTFDPSSAGVGGPYTIKYVVTSGGCTDSTSRTITIAALPDASFTGLPATLCLNDGSVTLVPAVSGGTFSGPGVSGTTFDPSSAGAGGPYTIKYVVTSGGCTDSTSETISVTALPDASFTGLPATLCLNDGSVTLVPAVSGGTFSGPGVSGTTFDPSSAGVGGPYTIKYVVTSGGCTDSTSETITVSPLPDASFTGLPATLCLNDGSVTLVPAVSGGTFSGPGVSGTTFDPSSAGVGGPYTIKYVVTSGGCTDSTSETITVSPLPDASFTGLPATLCLNDGSVTLVPAVSGGTFSGPGVSGTTFDPSSAGAGGPYTIKYVVTSGGCTDSTSETITVDPEDDASFTYSSGTYCLTGTDPAVIPGGSQTGGGVYSISAPGVINPSTGLIDLSASGLTGSPYTITYNTFTVGNPCPDTVTFVVAITTAPSAVFSYDQAAYCQDSAAPILTYGVGASGGVFSSLPSGLDLNTSTGAVNLLTSTPGVYTIDNDIAASGGCAAANASTTLEVLQVDSALFSYSSATYCVSGNDTFPTMGVNATLGGVFSISSPGVLLSTAAGEIDISASGIGVFTIYYNTAIVGNSCPAEDSVQVTITNAPSAAFSYDQAAYCQDSLNPILNLTGNNGNWSSVPVGLSLNSTNGAVDLLLSDTGVYTVYNTLVAAGGCAEVVDSTVIEVLQVDSALFSYSSATFCVTGTNPVATIGTNGTVGGVFTISSPGVLVSGATGEIDLAGSGLGTYTIYYNTTIVGNLCAAEDSLVIDIVNSPGATFTYNTPFCQGDTASSLPIFLTNNFAGTFSSDLPGVNFVDVLTGEINLATSSAGSYWIYNDLAASGGCAAAVDSFQVVINPMYIVPLNDTICQGDSILLAGSYQTVGGIYSDSLLTALGCDSILQTTLVVNPIYNVPLNDTICQGDSIFLAGAFQTIAGVYSDTLSSSGGCDSVLVTTLVVDPQLAIVAMNDDTICSSDPLVLSATASGSGVVEWFSDVAGVNSVGVGNPLTLPNPGNGTHTYYVNETGGACPSNIDSVQITVGGVVANISATPVTGAIPLNVSVDGTGSTGLITSWAWDFGNGNSGSDSITSNIYNLTGSYIIELIVSDGVCFDTATVAIDAFGESSIVIPNVFTPNGDGENDVFTVKGTNLASIQGEIFNRWGQKMFSWTNLKGFWDGRTLAGEEAPDGTYFYIITAVGIDGEEYFKKSGVSLIR